MSRTAHLVSLVAAVGLLMVAGCAQGLGDPGKTDTVVELQDTASDPAPASGAASDDAPAPDEATPVYFNETNYVEGTPNADASYTFDLLAGSRIAIRLARATETGPAVLGFKLYRFAKDGKTYIIGEAADTDGTAEASLWSEHGGTYVIEIAGGMSPASFALDLSCLSGSCSEFRQPGQACGTSDPNLCADGLVCRFADGKCKAGDTPAHCQIPPSSCSNTRAPVCGCDGQTWGNECFARAAGVSVARTGECSQGK